ncbi:MAG: hypothetical protein KC656_36045, partial [Myxococcales bacterium]|nr:hypothetical protein [Myxococcales bacterium]
MTKHFSEVVTALVLAGLGLALAAGAVQPSHDTLLLLDVGDRLVDGARPYVDYVETNPPLSHYLHAVVAGLARLVGVRPLTAMWPLVWSGTAFGAWLLAVKSTSVLGERGGPRAAAGWSAATLFVAAVGNLGQREHLFALLFLPYVVHRLRVREGTATPLAVWTGIAGAVGVCIKPHFLLVAAALEAMVWWRGRRALEPGFV